MTDTWTIRYEDEIEGKELRPGTSFAIQGEVGKRYNYLRTVITEDGSTWIDCFGGNSTRQMDRSVHHERVKANSIKAKPIKSIDMPGPTPRRGKR